MILSSFQAALCALRVLKKVPDLNDHFIAKAKNLLTDRNHGVLLTSITLVIEMCQIDQAILDEFRNASWFHHSPILSRTLYPLLRPSRYSFGISSLW